MDSDYAVEFGLIESTHITPAHRVERLKLYRRLQCRRGFRGQAPLTNTHTLMPATERQAARSPPAWIVGIYHFQNSWSSVPPTSYHALSADPFWLWVQLAFSWRQAPRYATHQAGIRGVENMGKSQPVLDCACQRCGNRVAMGWSRARMSKVKNLAVDGRDHDAMRL